MNALGAEMNMPEHPPCIRTVASMLAGLLATVAMSGCGAEVVGGAAAGGAMQASQAKQVQAQQAQVVDRLKAAQEAAVA